MHVTYKAEILLVPGSLTYCSPPFFNGLQNLHLHSCRSNRGPFGESSNKLIKELFSTDLEMERVSAIFDANIEEAKSKQRDVGVSVVDEIDDANSCFSRRIPFLGIDKVCDLEIHSEIGLELFGATCLLYISL
jgi:hypothetical protein